MIFSKASKQEKKSNHCTHTSPLQAHLSIQFTSTMASRKIPIRNILSRAGTFHSVRNAAQSNVIRMYAAKAQYTSPFQEIFDTIKEGKTFLGSKEFVIPQKKYLKCGVPEHVLRFKTTTYGRLLEEPYVRPNEHRVTLQVRLSQILLTDTEHVAFKEIVGTRLNDDTGILQLSSAQFGSRIENKRHVVSMLDRIVASSKDLAAKAQAELEIEEER